MSKSLLKKIFIILILFISTFINPFIFINKAYSYDYSYFVWSINDDAILTSTTPKQNISLESESAILIEQNTGKVLFEKNSHKKLRPASVTKVMSILLIMEALDSGKINLKDKVPCSKNAASMGGSQIWLDTREELTVDEMLKAICVASANDATVAMAEYLSGSEEAFVKNMNKRARELGMNDTTFKNCHGLDTDGHVTSSYDIALMSRELLKNHPNITKYTTIYMDSLRDGKSELVNTNKLIRNYKGATGLKTGSTGLALYNLSASATRDNLSLIAVIMKAPTTAKRFEEAQKLLDYGFSEFSYVSFAKKNEKLKNIDVLKGVKKNLEIVYDDNSGALLPKESKNRVDQIINIPNSIQAPIEKGDKVGEIEYKLNGKVIDKTNIIANETIKKITLSNMTEKIFYSWFSLLRK